MNAPIVDQTESPFFDYHCAQCDAPFCERVHLMNLALDYLEDEYCLDCLSQQQESDILELVPVVRGYIESRECFKTPWDAFDAKPCPRLEHKSCYCQDEPAV